MCILQALSSNVFEKQNRKQCLRSIQDTQVVLSSVWDAPRHLALHLEFGGCFIWGAKLSAENIHTSTFSGLTDITSSTEKLAVSASHVSVSHKLCQGIQFLPYSASAKCHEENSEIFMQLVNFINIHESKWNLTVAELLYLSLTGAFKGTKMFFWADSFKHSAWNTKEKTKAVLFSCFIKLWSQIA